MLARPTCGALSGGHEQISASVSFAATHLRKAIASSPEYRASTPCWNVTRSVNRLDSLDESVRRSGPVESAEAFMARLYPGLMLSRPPDAGALSASERRHLGLGFLSRHDLRKVTRLVARVSGAT